MAKPDLLGGLSVLELTAGAGRIAGRMLADLGANVWTTVAPTGDLDGHDPQEWAWATYWGHRKRVTTPGELALLEDGIDLVLAGADTPEPLHSRFRRAVWVWTTPFGRVGPRAGWGGGELICIASAGNLFPTGYPDRHPIACSRPTALVHGAADTAVGALFALATGRPETVDVSVQEATVGANLGSHTTIHTHGMRGARVGPYAGGVREIWPCADGHVSFAVRGGPARAANWVALRELLVAQGEDVDAFPAGDARGFDTVVTPQSEIDRIEEVLARFFLRSKKDELAGWARDRGIMMAPVVGPSEVARHPQFAHRELFDKNVPWPGFCARPFRVHEPASVAKEHRPRAVCGPEPVGRNVWSGLRIVEFGSAFAGPLVSRTFAEYGATCVHVESERQPDSARLVAATPIDATLPPMERSPLFAAINARKLSVQLDMKTEEGRALARRLAVEWADVLVENFSPRVLEGWGLGYEELSAERPDLVYVSSTMWGHDGPSANEKGFGGIGQAHSGHVYLTGFADRDPVFPFGLITDSLTPKIAAAGVAAALLRRRRTGIGCHLDVSQIETAAYTIGSWLLEDAVGSTATARSGNDFAPSALIHGVFPARGDDRWIAIAAWDARAADQLAAVLDLGPGTPPPEDVARATAGRDADELAERLQAVGVDAYPVLDLVDVVSDPQLVERGHFVDVPHPVHGIVTLEQAAFRIDGLPPEPATPGPLLGHDTVHVLTGILGLADEEVTALADRGVLR